MILVGASPEVCDLTQTIDTLLALRIDAWNDGNFDGWNIIRRALQHVQSTSRMSPRSSRKPVARVVRKRVTLPPTRPKKPSQMAREIMSGILRDSLTSRAAEAYR